MTLDGVLVIDKPVGMTSFDVVRQVRRAAGVRRVGHGGTLDPLASGVLPICLGEATKLAQFLLDADKAYDVTVCFGVETDTLDADGAVTARHDASALTEAAVRAALAAFTGRIQQVPPAYSAIKRQGRPLYQYARAGETIEVAARPVTVHELTLVNWAGPEVVSLSVRCSKGTYVRAPAADLGRALGPGAHVTALRRTRSGPFALAAARPLEPLLASLAGGDPQATTTTALAAALIAPAAALGHLPSCTVGEDEARALAQGRRVPWAALLPLDAPSGEAQPNNGEAPRPSGRVCVLRPGGALLAVCERRAEDDGADSVRTLRVFGAAAASAPPAPSPPAVAAV